MTFSGYIGFLFLLTAPLVINGAGEPPQCRKGLVVDCRLSHEDVIWTTENQQQCKPIVNRCVFNNANCYRYRQGQPLLKEIPKSDCQKLCVQDCGSAPKVPICASRSNNYCTFDSECDWNKHICNTGEIWSQELQRFCESQGSGNVCP